MCKPSVNDPKPKGPPGWVAVPLPAPIRYLPAPKDLEPMLPPPTAKERRALLQSIQEQRQGLSEAGRVLNRVVFDSTAFIPPSPDRVPGGALLFESRFESGNLRRAVHVCCHEYDLLLSWDHGTRGHTQWFFFACQGAEAGEDYRFNIVNFCKSQSLCGPA